MNSNEKLSFRTSGKEWVIALSDVVEILESPHVIRLPLLPDQVPGVIAVRGLAVPAIVVEAAQGDGDASGVRRAAILTSGKRCVALLVDEVYGIVEDVPAGASPIDLAALLDSTAAGRDA